MLIRRALLGSLVGLFLLIPAGQGSGSIYVNGQEGFRFCIYSAMQIVDNSGWRLYVTRNIGLVEEAFDSKGGWAVPDKQGGPGAAYFDVHTCDGPGISWLAMALVHEAAHNEISRQGQKTCGKYGEEVADYITQAFAVSTGLVWTIRDPESIPEKTRGDCGGGATRGWLEY